TTTLSGKVTAGTLVPTGSVTITLNSVSATATIAADGTFSTAFATGTLGVTGSPYAVSYAYAGDANFAAIAPNGAGTVTVGKANQTITFGGLANKTYGDAPFPVSAT